MEKLFDFDDILIQPTTISTINSRSEVNPRMGNGMLPLMTAPMDTVISDKNFKLYEKNGIVPVMPRISNVSSDYTDTSLFLSYSLEDFHKVFLDKKQYVPINHKLYALIDVANGHMRKLWDITNEAKQKYGDTLFLMIGNVANPRTFYEYGKLGVDAVRIGIGNGNGCLTTVQTGVGYPMGSLIYECKKLKDIHSFKTKIVADGGFKKYSDIIKGLALGADYVMLGSILNKALESAGVTTYNSVDNVIDQYSEKTMEMFKLDFVLHKVFRGMSTKEVQKSWGKEKTNTSEGVVRINKVEYTLDGWVKNFEDYLKSAMSYSGKKELHDFIGGVEFNYITENSFRRFDK